MTPGAGLTGMRERFESQGGSLELTTAAGEGFRAAGVHATRKTGLMIRLAIVDDQTLVRRGIRSLLELAGGFEVIGGEAADGDEAIVIIPMHPSRGAGFG